MEKGDANGAKTDVWSFGISICVMFGLFAVYQKHHKDGSYKGGAKGFFMDCANSRQD